MAVFLEFQNHQVAILRGCHLLKFFDGKVEETHDEEADGQSVGHEDAIFGEIFIREITIKTTQQVVHAVIDI